MVSFIEKINLQFYDFVNNYDVRDPNIVRKIIHSNTVADNCFLIAGEMKLNSYDRNLAYLCGILHDMGRFEQWKKYQTYNDHASVDHGELSYELLEKFNFDCIEELDVDVVRQAIRFHTKKYSGDNARIKLFNRILINADNYSNIINTANGTQHMFTDANGYTPEVVDAFKNNLSLNKYNIATRLDRSLLLTSAVYNLDIDFLKRNVLNLNLLDHICEYLSTYLMGEDLELYQTLVADLKNKLYQDIK